MVTPKDADRIGAAGVAPPAGPGAVGAPAVPVVPAVSARGLWKRFGDKAAVAGVNLQVPPGSFYGLVGPNGAGKTTTLSMMTGLLRPDAGTVEIAGNDVWRDPAAVKAVIGVLPEGLRLFERLSGRELLRYLGRLRGLPRAEVDSRADELLAVLDLTDDARTLVIDYSTGMRKKIALAAALLHNPRVLFLDEPFEGVDPVAAQTIRSVLDAYTRSGSTVIFSSHVMELVQSLCDWVAVMSHGQIMACGTLDEIRSGRSLQEAFLAIIGARPQQQNGRLSWLGSSSD
jgi:ABC-2 type transport system ATP-binding protein